ncbi:hypothetical protein H6P81_010315 [Aristolochia fimbriata]|uniref:Reverse transcriptase Ty1/copia-type domain-containing protein n=1 Tax=Aristolochia fimbriata TaxID=158543 RepID=A0AAV7ENF8_ARIFI|nr:hypothetical protein H6P81_010315 [Aristolochia fimbriata]
MSRGRGLGLLFIFWWSSFGFCLAGEPKSYDEAMADEAHLKWELAMKDEMLSLEENQTWELVKMPAKKKVLQNKWIFRVKQEAGGVQRYKARLVVKGFGQREDDMLVAGTNMKKIDDLKKRLANQFSMKDLGEAKQLLGMQITRDKKKKKL